MNLYSDYVYYQGTNNPVAGVAVSVYLHNTMTPAVLYTSTGVALPTNIVTTDQTGYFQFYTLTGQYDLYLLGELYYTVSINEMTGVPDPLTLTGLTVSGTATIGTVLVNGAVDDTIAKLQVSGSITSVAVGFTAPYALPQSGVRTAGSSAFQTNIRSHMFSDTAGARPAFGLSKNLLGGGYPSSTGGGLGVLQYGTIIPSTQTFTSQAEIAAYTAEAWTDSARGSTLQFFTTPIGSTTLTERMRISAAGNLVVGSVTDSNQGLVAAYKTITGSDTSTAIAVHSSLTDSSDGTGSASHFALSTSAGFTGAVTGGALMGAITTVVNTGTSFSTSGTLYGSLLQFVHTGTPTTSTIMGNLTSVTLSAGTTVNVATALRSTLGLNGTLTSTAYGIRSVISCATTTNVSSTHCMSVTATLNGTTTTVYGAFYALNPSTTSTITTLNGSVVLPTLPASGTNINNFIGNDVGISTAGMLCNGVRCYQAQNSAIQAAASGGFAYAFYTDANTKPGVVVYAFLASGNAPSKFNGGINTPNLPVYADNAAAIAGGLVAGDHYRTSTGVLMVRY